MFKNFIKYHSLGNDLIIFDLYKEKDALVKNIISDDAWKKFVVRVCDRHYGIGGDGVLLVSKNGNMPEMHVFNADGSQAENCLNGVRCVAHYIYSTYEFRESFSIKIGSRTVLCEVNFPQHTITTRVGFATCEGLCEVFVPMGKYSGYIVSIGNPHFIVFEKTTSEWLSVHGKTLESHELFPKRTNVEFVWKEKTDSSGYLGIEPQSELIYTMLIYERGCGLTLACSSGAAALTGLLFSQHQILQLQKIIIKMPGGSVSAWVDSDGQIVLQAEVALVFKGVLEGSAQLFKLL